MSREYVAVIMCSAEVQEKIKRKHSVTLAEVKEAALFNRGGRLEDHPKYGRRLLIRGTTYGGRTILAVLAPLDASDGLWVLRTALEPGKQKGRR